METEDGRAVTSIQECKPYELSCPQFVFHVQRKRLCGRKYSRTSLYGHLSNMDTSLLRTVSYVPTKFSNVF